MTRLALVIPCYNEAARLDDTPFLAALDAEPRLDLILVNDGSSDATLSRLTALAAPRPGRVFVLDRQPNAGKAEAVRAGMREALAREYALTGYWDADLATPLDALPALWQTLDARPELAAVLGSRVQLLGRHIERKAARHYAGRVFASLASLLLKMPVYDTQCGAKLFRVDDTLRSALAHPFEARWIFDVELLARLVDLRASRGLAPLVDVIVEHPLERWRDVGGSKVRPLDFPRALRDLARIERARRLSGRQA